MTEKKRTVTVEIGGDPLKASTMARMVYAARMEAMGQSKAAIAERLHVEVPTVARWARVHKSIWQAVEKEFAKEMARTIAEVRATAGTDAVFQEPDEYVLKASQAERWLAMKGEALFPDKGAMTMTRFLDEHYVPVCLANASPGCIAHYRIVVKRWRLLTGDPPLTDITVGLLAKFRDSLAVSRGLKPHRRMSPTTVHTMLRVLQTLLDKAGEPHYRNRDAVAIIKGPVPWIRPPRAEARPVRVVTPEELDAVYQAAVAMEVPRIAGFKPPAWWRALLVLVYNSGLRRRTLFSIRMEWIDWASRRISIPPQSMKSHRWHAVHLNETTFRHLLAIRTERELLFEWPLKYRETFSYWHKLLCAAGIPPERHFGMHDLRKTHATLLWGDNPQAAQLSLGHTASDVTIRHYVQADGIVAKALDALPQPKAFATTAT